MEERENENYYQDEVKQRPREEEKKKKNITVTLIIFGVLLLLILGIKYCIDHWMPEYQLNKGKKYLEQGEVQKALDMFELARKGMPYNNEPIYYKAVALSKLPMNYENQKALYEIAQLDDCDEASDFAEQTLMNNRKTLESQLGPNYLDNVLFEDRLIRWNNNEPITYSISSDIAVPQNYYEDVRTAFNNWQNATDNQITFQEVQNNNSKINILFTDNITLENSYQPDIAGSTVPVLKDNVLLKMDVKLRDTDKFGNSYGDDQLITLAEHEIGHALGLGAHSAREEDVMFYTGD